MDMTQRLAQQGLAIDSDDTPARPAWFVTASPIQAAGTCDYGKRRCGVGYASFSVVIEKMVNRVAVPIPPLHGLATSLRATRTALCWSSQPVINASVNFQLTPVAPAVCATTASKTAGQPLGAAALTDITTGDNATAAAGG